jgi:hypothetical protein
MARPTGKAARKPAGRPPKVPRIVRIAQRLGRMIPEEELRRIPKDLSSQVDHYVYGLPKR